MAWNKPWGIEYTPKGVRRGTYAVVRYADDLVVFSPTYEKAVEAQHLLSTWLETRGLRLSGEKPTFVTSEKALISCGSTSGIIPHPTAHAVGTSC
jgi:Reverse transcriptase (RNA-dependent DNA polymerase)